MKVLPFGVWVWRSKREDDRQEQVKSWNLGNEHTLEIRCREGNVVSIYELLSTICTPLTHCASSSCLSRRSSAPSERRGCRVLRQLHLIAHFRSRHSQMRPRPDVRGCHHQRRCQGGLVCMSRGREGRSGNATFRSFSSILGIFWKYWMGFLGCLCNTVFN